jgi:hypothetical protein
MELRSSSCKKDKIKSRKLTRKCKEHSNHGNMHERRKNPRKLMANPQSDHHSCRTGVELSSSGCKKDKTKSGRPT